MSDVRPVATLWRLALNDDQLSCNVYRQSDGFELRVESATAIILAERFELQPRMVARTERLRESLTRRGWQETPPD
jgi:hypothetical protein